MNPLRLSASSLTRRSTTIHTRPHPRGTPRAQTITYSRTWPCASIRHQSSSSSPTSPSSTSSASSASTTQCQQDIQSQRSAQQDRTRIDRQPSEYSKSGTDDAVASQPVSFSPDSTATADPARSIAQAAAGQQVQIQNSTSAATKTTTTGTSNEAPTPPSNAPFNPLEVSPANVEISSTTSETEGATAVVRDAQKSRTYVGTTTQKSKSKSTTSTTAAKRVFAGTDTRKDAMPGGAAQEGVEGTATSAGTSPARVGGKGPIIRPGSR
ncbi:hypothetical protein Z517_04646 [Fonsecaea pedrosoi CBS 271.37]|uniref:Unplaced genomic scaffold supercont1.3, whole genome shotgun sequence n=1 Tax=Fonsecaea pedrosoi CBS 271.37 TaxID=1442368 RepID=A0A0D2GST1_9EURO|nr:uncharacterized protein Z517_04646 [Fonsecaea pedrosoi CBS 271.37]KIW81620.1 hypothetical protein Z517_04646 [Fonsecaea pedrosoi CBS 271.37]